ncbi:PTS lactose/cellobiose transporter subunit IIA [Youngiibacter fragilis]|jgi:PTS system cellobiose-specific IIA component|uniref:PTS mannose transporter subunit IIA n=1 Tax=Youngiibacter fragilis 232.1 TaxID=994573 RepID=V7I7R3_9CLOT|nr:PTS lactose/cellobiose transporter subunit IIA [Youngiibacter fragilis]ETA81274.1 PTS mannose transporter subunit IIA [Youngiibacter fragilis 232.1]
MDNQTIIFNIIMNGGDAKSYAMESIRTAKKGEMAQARNFLTKSGESLEKAHEIQTALIQEEAAGNSTELSLLMVHAQDHFMNALTVRDLAREIVDVYDLVNSLKEKLG